MDRASCGVHRARFPGPRRQLDVLAIQPDLASAQTGPARGSLHHARGPSLEDGHGPGPVANHQPRWLADDRRRAAGEGMRYVDSLIEWLENHAMSGTGARLTPKQCGEIANRLRSEEGPEPIFGICGKPGQH